MFDGLKLDRQQRMGLLLGSPTTVFLILFFVIPSVILFVYSFWSSKAFVVIPDATLKNYIDALTSRSFPGSLWTGVKIGLWTAILSVALSFPVAFYIAYRATSNTILYVVLLSWFASYLVRIYAWRTILGTNGLINSGLQSVGITTQPLEFLIFSPLAVIITLVHIFLPFTLLLLLSALRNISKDLIDAARDLGATRIQTFTKVILPMANKGVVGSLMFTFILGAGDFIAPQLLGGREGVTTGLLISNQFRTTGNWPLGAALAFLLLLVFLLIYFAVVYLFKVLKLAPGVHHHD